MKKLKTVFFIFLMVIISTVPMCQNNTSATKTTETLQMPYKNFTLNVTKYEGTLIDYEGAKYLNLSMAYGSFPMGIIYHQAKGVVYIALLPEASNAENVYGVAEVNVTSKNLKIYRFPWYIDGVYYGPMPWTITVDKDNNLWISIRSYCVTSGHLPEAIPYLAKLETETAKLTIYYIPNEMGAGSDIKYYADYVWYMTTKGLSKISLDGIIQEYYLRYFAGGFMKPDLDCIWISSVTGGFITRFNITAKLFDANITELDRPLGIEVDESYVYVAENSQVTGKYGTIAVVDKKDFMIKERKQTVAITNEGPYHVLKDSFGNLWWTDNSKHFGYFNAIGVTLTVFDAISQWCYFMCEAPNTIWFSVKGSAYVGLVTITGASATSGGAFGGSNRKYVM